MRKPVWSSFNAPLRMWTAFIGAVFKRSARIQGVFLHDPAAGRPKNRTIPSTMRRLRNEWGTSSPAPLEPQNANHRNSLRGVDWSLDLARSDLPKVNGCLGSPAATDTARRRNRQRMDQSVPPFAEGVNLISTSTEVPRHPSSRPRSTACSTGRSRMSPACRGLARACSRLPYPDQSSQPSTRPEGRPVARSRRRSYPPERAPHFSFRLFGDRNRRNVRRTSTLHLMTYSSSHADLSGDRKGRRSGAKHSIPATPATRRTTQIVILLNSPSDQPRRSLRKVARCFLHFLKLSSEKGLTGPPSLHLQMI